MQFEEFSACHLWWNHRTENERAWKIPIVEVVADNYNLDRDNPHAKPQPTDKPPDELAGRIIETEARIAGIMEQIRDLIAKPATMRVTSKWPKIRLQEVLKQVSEPYKVNAAESYPNLSILSFGRGLFGKPPISGATTSAHTLYRVRRGQFIYSRLFAFEGAYGLVSESFDGYYVSNEYPLFEIDTSTMLPEYLALYFTWPEAWHDLAKRTSGMGNRRRRLQPEQFLAHEIPTRLSPNKNGWYRITRQ